MGQHFQDVCERAQFNAAAGGSKPGTDGGGEERFFPNPKRSKAQKEMHGKRGVNHGGIAASYLAKV